MRPDDHLNENDVKFCRIRKIDLPSQRSETQPNTKEFKTKVQQGRSKVTVNHKFTVSSQNKGENLQVPP